MDKQDWLRVEQELSDAYGCGVVLLADGYRLALRVTKVKGLRYAVMVYVNDFWKAEYAKADSEVGAKFYRRVPIGYFTPAMLRKIQKNHGKRFAAKMAKKFPGSHYYMPTWSSVVALRRHLAKTCVTVELVSCGYVPKDERTA